MKYGMLTFKEPQPDTSRKILHVDMDAFYANVEARDNPAIANKPIVIAQHPKLTQGRGIVSTCNYIARTYGIHSAMTAIEAYRRCPHAVFIRGNMQHYANISRQIRDIFAQYTDVIEPLSLDEAYLDVTHNKKGMKSATLLAKQIQQHVLSEVGLTCSIGVSYNKFLAKVASDFHKPFGLTVVTPEDALTFLDQLPIEKFYGVGKKSVPLFHELNIRTGADLREMSLDDLMTHFGKMGYSLYLKVRGVHDAPVAPKRERKSLGREMTFTNFLQTEGSVYEIIKTLSEKVSHLMQQKHLKAQTLTLKIRYDTFETHTRQLTQEEYFDDKERCEAMAMQLWEAYGDTMRPIRLLGISVSKFENPYFTPITLNI